MAGIYIHIPFCSKACHYCDFHFSINISIKNDFLKALTNEIKYRSTFLFNQTIETIYFGGGTPSLLNPMEINQILKTIYNHYKLSESLEITFETNPDDVSEIYLKDLHNLGINRLSIGIQTFNDQLLKVMNRNHSSSQSENAIKIAQNTGFDNLNIDLIYSYPSKIDNLDFNTIYILQNDLEKMCAFDISHISAYHLTIEEKTVFGNWNSKGKLSKILDDNAIIQFDLVVKTLFENGFEQYEISNFARNRNYSKHNSAYWLGKNYIGLGPSAHSFKDNLRISNISNNKKYIDFWLQNDYSLIESIQNLEILSSKDKANEHILTRLRTKWGIEIQYIKKLISNNQSKIFDEQVLKNLNLKLIEINKNHIFLTQEGKYLADKVALDLFCE